MQLLNVGQDPLQCVENVLLNITILQSFLCSSQQQRGDALLLRQKNGHGCSGLNAQNAQAHVALLAVERREPEAVSGREAAVLSLVLSGEDQRSQVSLLKKLQDRHLVAAESLDTMLASGKHGDKARPHLQQVAECCQRILQEGTQVG